MGDKYLRIIQENKAKRDAENAAEKAWFASLAPGDKVDAIYNYDTVKNNTQYKWRVAKVLHRPPISGEVRVEYEKDTKHKRKEVAVELDWLAPLGTHTENAEATFVPPRTYVNGFPPLAEARAARVEAGRAAADDAPADDAPADIPAPAAPAPPAPPAPAPADDDDAPVEAAAPPPLLLLSDADVLERAGGYPSTVVVSVQPSMRPGQKLTFRAPDYPEPIQVVVPPGSVEGTKLEINLPPPSFAGALERAAGVPESSGGYKRRRKSSKRKTKITSSKRKSSKRKTKKRRKGRKTRRHRRR